MARRAPPQAESRLLGRILQRPELAATIPEEATGGSSMEAAALRAVIGLLQVQPRLTLGQVSAYFDGSEHQAAITDALAEPLLNQLESPDFDLEAEVADLVGKLRDEHLARRSRELMRLLEAGTATPEQRAEYDRLHARLATAKSGNPVPEARSKL